MSEELIKCSCCGKMVPAKNIELTFRLPDSAAQLNQDERAKRCQSNTDICIKDNKEFFIKCTAPLPVHESSKNYSLGVWVKISESSYKRIDELWGDDNQINEPPIPGSLANTVPLTEGSTNTDVYIQLTGPTTRPEVFFKNPSCSLYNEQQHGITAHRASEYSDLCRK